MNQEHLSRRSLVAELVVVTSSILLVAHLLYRLRTIPWIEASLATFVALLFLYVPTLILRRRGRRIDFLDRSLRDVLHSLRTFLIAATLIFPPYFGVAHIWQKVVVGAGEFSFTWPASLHELAFYHFLLIALPEEFYFRGYFQSTIDRIFSKRWSILGVRLGVGWIITAFVFAFAHSLVTYQWWHFSIFFPALLFGYLRERTGSITAPILFHAASNILLSWFLGCYG